MKHNRSEMMLTRLLHLLFIGTAAIAIVIASSQTVVFQDTWILEGIWFFIAFLVILYLLIAMREKNLSRVALLSSCLVTLLYLLPMLKYEYPYGSTPDVAYHVQLARQISQGNFNTNELYSFSPGFHLIVALLSQFSGLSVVTWIKFITPCLAFIIPLATYSLCSIGRISASLSKMFIILSVLVLPNLYMTNGTTFTVTIILIVMTLYCLRELFRTEKLIFSFLIILFFLVLTFWHPPSSMIFPGLLLILGILGGIRLVSAWDFIQMRSLLILGLLGIVVTISYWLYHAGLVWSFFVTNLRLLMEMDSTTGLIPEKLFTLDLGGQLIVVLVNHSKDLLFLSLGLYGSIRYFHRKFREQLNNITLEIFSSVFFAFLLLILLVFLAQYGSQGYKRFLFYIISVSIFPAGYGLYSLINLLVRKIQKKIRIVTTYFILLLIFVFSSFQIYPYQPIVPDGGNEIIGSSPIVWMHEVNTVSQYYATRYALSSLLNGSHAQVLVDSVTGYQMKLFWGSEAASSVAHVRYARPAPGYLMLHKPGIGGGYREQSEYRGELLIKGLKDFPRMGIVYDNGTSFILYYPGDITHLELLEK